ncbi:MAG TPA: HNH endonuclease [Kofleriaceae bacterium]|nr:HNH endonuclease [Kofleriaceae bacterium]
MTRDGMVKVEREVVAQHTQVDRALRRIAVAHAALDADEAHWLRIAEQQRVWPKLGYVHAFEYLEEVFGYAPRTAKERLRVARELGDMPQLEDALRCGETSWSVARELTRVATSDTIERWLDEARGRRLRDVEQMVAGRKKGDLPGDPADPARVKHRVVLELDGESFVVWRQMQQSIEIESDRKLDDRDLVLAIGRRILGEAGHRRREESLHAGGPAAGAPASGVEAAAAEAETTAAARTLPAPGAAAANGNVDTTVADKKAPLRSVVARYMIQLTTCRDCGRGWQDGAGVRVEVDRSVVDRAQCNAVICDDEKGMRPKRTIPARIERLVLERAQHRCEVPGCRSSRYLAIHHIVFWSHGGTHELSNLIVLCDGHHRLLHDGLLKITGEAPDKLAFERGGVPLAGREGHAPRKHVAAASVKRAMNAPDLERDDPATLAQAALRQLGFKAPLAARAVDEACAHVGTGVELGVLIREALRHCGER